MNFWGFWGLKFFCRVFEKAWKFVCLGVAKYLKIFVILSVAKYLKGTKALNLKEIFRYRSKWQGAACVKPPPLRRGFGGGSSLRARQSLAWQSTKIQKNFVILSVAKYPKMDILILNLLDSSPFFKRLRMTNVAFCYKIQHFFKKSPLKSHNA